MFLHVQNNGTMTVNKVVVRTMGFYTFRITLHLQLGK